MDYTQPANHSTPPPSSSNSEQPPAPPGSQGNNCPYTPPAPQPPRRKRGGGCLIAVVIAVLLLAGGLTVILAAGMFFSGFAAMGTGGDRQDVQEEVIQPGDNGRDKIAVISIKGIIGSDVGTRGADPFLLQKQFRKALRDPHVKAVVLDLNTPGGEVTASDEIRQSLDILRSSGKPVVGCMRSVCASGGYYIASGCDHLVANGSTLTGSIGVIFPHFIYRELLDKVGVEQTSYTSGKMKDMLSGTAEHTESEKQLIDRHMQTLVDQTFNSFLEVIAEGRKQYENVEELRGATFTDGRIILGKDALDYGLVDQLGYLRDAIDKARQLADAPGATVIRYRKPFSIADLLLARAGEQKISVEGLPRLMPPLEPYNLYYLMPPLN